MAKNKTESERSGMDLRMLSLILFGVAILLSGYMTFTQLSPEVDILCAESATVNCQAVEQSKFGYIVGIPVSVLGLLTNITMFVMLLIEPQFRTLRENNPIIIFGVMLFATLFSIWLIVAQAFLLKQYCLWCLTHEALIFILFGISIARLRQMLA